MGSVFLAVYQRDLRLALRRRVEALLPVVFFVVAISLFPLGVGPEPQILRQMAAGIVWVSALLATMLSVTSLYAGDHGDGSLEQMILSGHPGSVIAAAKAAAHWTVTGAPLVAGGAAARTAARHEPAGAGGAAGVAAAGHTDPVPARRHGRGVDAGAAQRRRAADPADRALVDPGPDLRCRGGQCCRSRSVGGRPFLPAGSVAYHDDTGCARGHLVCAAHRHWSDPA